VSDTGAPIAIDVKREHGLEVTWEDGSSTLWELEDLRRRCPCAACRTERDRGRPVWPLATSPRPLRITDAEIVGAWGLGITWNDGHRTGIYSWALLRRS
jgi:DUF971 family protein